MTTPPSFDPQPCCDGEGNTIPCPEPVQFHRTTTSTAPVTHPGRTYDLTVNINPGFAVQSLQVDAVTHAANIVWDVADPDGEQFRQDLTAFIDTRIPSDAVVTITNPNAGLTICGTAAAMQIHIECLRLDQSPPNLIELVYNAGRDMVINPAYNETPPLNPPVSQGNYGFRLLAREDDPGPFPGNPPAERANCTTVANRGWETNDVGRTFEIWGQDIVNGSNVTPTPRGTPVQEMTSDGPPPGGRSTIWQTFQAPATGNFIIRVVHGARDAGEDHRITLDNGDTNDAQNGDLIDNVTTNVGVVTNSAGGPGPWTTFNQTIPLTSGSTYTLALSTNNPAGGARGGLFTDMRAYLDIPDQRATATTDDETCVVTASETSNVCTDELWVPVCTAGTITSWQNAQTGVTLTNAAFWGQAPAPVPGACPGTSSGGDGGSVAANLAYTYPVCATVGGVRTNLQRVVIADASGGVLADTFIGPDGGPVATPSSYSIGSCTDTAFVNDVVLCDFTPGGRIPFLRKYVQSLDDTGRGQIKGYQDFDFFSNLYTVSGIVGVCTPEDADREPACWTQTSTGNQIHTGTIRHSDDFPSPGWLLYDQNQNLIPSTEPGLTFVPCGQADPVATTGLCLPDGTPLAVVVRRNSVTGTVTQDGWINLTTGAFTAGAPPVGVVACGSSQSIQVSGTFCSVDDTTGDVLALILIEYTYAADGSIESVRLVDATTGTTYVVPAGATVTTCPTGTEQPEQDLEVLCDVNAGVSTPFIRDYRRNETGAIVATSNYTLAGAAYVPTGTVGICEASGSVSEFVMCDEVSIPTGPAVQRITNGDFAASATGWTIVGNANWTDNAGYAGPDAAVGVLALNGGNLPANAVVTQTVNTGITPGDVFHLQARLGTKSTDSGSNGPIRVLIEVLDGGSNVLYSQQYVPTMAVGGVAIQWPANGVVNVPGIVATDSAITVRFTDQSGPGGLTGADGAIDAVSLTQQASAGTTNTPFIRKLIQDQAGTVLSVVDLTLDGDPYAVQGTVGTCPVEIGTIQVTTEQQDVESFILCDSAAPTPNRVILNIRFDAESGAYLGQETRNLAGAIVAPVGALQVCAQTVATDLDFDQVVMSDANNTCFIRRFTFNSDTGAVTATTNLTLAGASFAPVGAVTAGCNTCCPNVIGEGCTNTGSGRYTAIRAANGTVTLIDSVSGAAVTAGQIVACPGDDTVRTLTAQARVLTNSAPWTPGADVVGTLTSLTVTGTSGLWDMVDANGTALTGLPAGLSLTWEAEDDNQLTGPTSVTPQAGATVIANWTMR